MSIDWTRLPADRADTKNPRVCIDNIKNFYTRFKALRENKKEQNTWKKKIWRRFVGCSIQIVVIVIQPGRFPQIRGNCPIHTTLVPLFGSFTRNKAYGLTLLSFPNQCTGLRHSWLSVKYRYPSNPTEKVSTHEKRGSRTRV